MWLGIVAGSLIAYSVVTQVGNSQLVALLTQQGGLAGISLQQGLQSIFSARSDTSSVSSTLLRDLSYDRAALHAPSAVIWHQAEDGIGLGWGRVSFTEGLAHLPAIVRPDWATAATAEKAGIRSGALLPVDQVESILLGLVLDFGWLGPFLPTVVFGMLLGIIDRCLRRVSHWPHCEWIEVYRLAWLLQLMFANSSAWPVVLFVKASIGLALLLAVTNVVLDVRLLPRRQHPITLASGLQEVH
jgi:hypothetical protein